MPVELPTVGADAGTWGTKLNAFLLVEHFADGTHNISGKRFDYEQSTDPGAVGAGAWWYDDANNIVYRRNETDSAWIVVAQPAVATPASFQFEYEQPIDPGPVGANKWWANTANNTLNRRNAANTGWILFNASPIISPSFTLILDSLGEQVQDSTNADVIIPFTNGLVSLDHSLITDGQLIHQPFHYEQQTDPGAVGAGKWWYDEVSNLIKRRNAGDDDWEIMPTQQVAPPEAPTPVSITDDFNGPDGAVYGAQQIWTTVVGAANRVSNKIQPVTTGSQVIGRCEVDMATADHFCQFVVDVSEETAGGNVGCLIRMRSSPTLTYYLGDINFSGNQIRLYQWIDNVSTNLAIVSQAFTAGVPVTIRLQAVGTTIKVFVNTVEKISVINGTITSGTRVGFRSTKIAPGFCTLDSFAAEDI